jgi:hypothetical protein
MLAITNKLARRTLHRKIPILKKLRIEFHARVGVRVGSLVRLR